MNYNHLYTDPLCWVLTAWLCAIAIMAVFANYHRR